MTDTKKQMMGENGMKKRLMSILLLSALMMCALAGCGPAEAGHTPTESENAVSVADTYREMAQDFLDRGDYDAAVSILEKGIAATGDAGLADMLKEALALQLGSEPASEGGQSSASDEVPGFADIMGVWQNEENSGVIMIIDYFTNINGETTPHIWYEVGPGLEGVLYSEDGGETFTGALLVGDASQPSSFVEIYRYKYWLEVTFSDDGGVTYAKFVPAE